MTHNPDAFTQKDLTEEDWTVDDHPIDLALCFTLENGDKYESSTLTNENVGLQGDGTVEYGTTSSPTPPPTPAPTGQCQDFCETSGSAWSTKCKWGKCEGCSSCNVDHSSTSSPTASPTATDPPTPAPTDQCQSFCEGNSKEWSTKCTWGKCKGCSACTTSLSEAEEDVWSEIDNGIDDKFEN